VETEHKICEKFSTQVGAVDSELARRWGLFSGLAHPTALAARNSVAITAARISNRGTPDLTIALEEKRADYLTSIATLFITASFEFPGWIHLGCGPNRMPTAERFRIAAPAVVLPILMRKEGESRPIALASGGGVARPDYRGDGLHPGIHGSSASGDRPW